MKAERMIAIFLLGTALFVFPGLALFGEGGFVWGVPILYVYLFAAWAVVIGLMGLVVERRSRPRRRTLRSPSSPDRP